MKKFFLLIFTVCLINTEFAQDKYFIYLKDKAIAENSVLSKSSSDYSAALDCLSDAALIRRVKNRSDRIISYKDIPVRTGYLNEIKSCGIKIIHSLKWLNAVSAYLTEGELNLLQRKDFVKNISRVKSFKVKYPVNNNLNTFLTKQNSVNLLHDYGFSLTQDELSDVPVVHGAGINGSGVRIGIIDSGFLLRGIPSVQDLDIIAEYDFVMMDSVTEQQPGDPAGQQGHGTSVLSICGGFDESEIVGPAYGASFLLAKTEDVSTEKRVEEDNFAAAVEWMENQGVDIITTSLGYNLFDDPAESYSYEDMDGKTAIITISMETAFENGVVTITSAGNEGDDPWKYITAPADGENIIAVGAVNSQNIISDFSSLGPTYDGRLKPEILAMGKRVYMAGTGGGYKFGDGTSYAAPIVAGIAGQLLAAHPHLSNRQVRDLIIRSGDNFSGPDNVRGHGLVSAAKAVTYPNIKSVNSISSIQKIFFDINISGVELPQIYLRNGSGEFFQSDLQKDELHKYHYTLNNTQDGEKIQFCFNYTNAQNEVVKEPSDGLYEYVSGTEIINIIKTAEDPTLSEDFVLTNRPNPFNDFTLIEFSIPRAGFTTIKIFNVLGELIDTPVSESLEPDFYSIKYNLTQNKNISSGVYFYQLTANGITKTKKMMFIK